MAAERYAIVAIVTAGGKLENLDCDLHLHPRFDGMHRDVGPFLRRQVAHGRFLSRVDRTEHSPQMYEDVGVMVFR